ncbi:HVA22-like protein k [Silene latifolia]|uniref:HVA22-like protein k n=1 Tax=Silene latifolia TaxID=37657 RepID=UPI003D77F926
MAFMGSSHPLEVGLRLLLSPPGSNIVVRTACCSVGVVLPVYSTFKAIERKDPDEQQRCLVYWAAFGSFTVAEAITDKLIHWLPYYYHMKFAFLVWLQLPSTDGATQLYMNHLRPFLLRHQATLDHIVGFMDYHLTKLATSYEAQFRFLKKVMSRILATVYRTLRGSGRGIEGPSDQEEEESSESDDED